MSEHPPVPRAPFRPARALLVAALAVSALIAGLGWVFASSPGSAPDDDYHLVSTWCPRPIASSGCETTTIDGEVHVMAPVTTSHAQCEAFSPDKSHACINDYSDSMMFPSYRYNDGAYPYGFYQFHHLFAGASVEASAWHMRVVNVLIALVLLGGVCALAPASMRQGLFLAITLAWIPMGAYFIASNNPSSWAITGVFSYGAGLFGALRSDGRRRWALLGIALVGALLCFGSRGDAAFYVFVVSLGVLIAVGRRDRIVEIAGASVLSAIGVWLMAGGGQAGKRPPEQVPRGRGPRGHQPVKGASGQFQPPQAVLVPGTPVVPRGAGGDHPQFPHLCLQVRGALDPPDPGGNPHHLVDPGALLRRREIRGDPFPQVS